MESIRGKLLFVSLSIWGIAFIVADLLLITLTLGSLLSKEWAVSPEWKGGILRINDGANKGQHYSEISCEGDCIFSRLHKAGVVVIVFDLLNLIFLLIWLSALVYNTRHVDLLKHWMKFAITISASCSHFIAIITWGAVVNIGFNSSHVHSSTGPAIAVAVSVLEPLFSMLYLILFAHTEPTNHVPEMNSVRVERRHQWSDDHKPSEPDNRN